MVHIAIKFVEVVAERTKALKTAYTRQVNLETLFDILCGPTQLSNYTIQYAVPILINFRFQMHAK
jgi:hypothetical protein